MACACEKTGVQYVAKTPDGVEHIESTVAAAQKWVRDAGGGTVRAANRK